MMNNLMKINGLKNLKQICETYLSSFQTFISVQLEQYEQ